MSPFSMSRIAAFVALALFAVPPAAAHALAAAGLQQKYGELRDRLAKSPFGRPLALDSEEKDSRLQGDVYAVVPHSFSTVRGALAQASGWCDVLTLPFNMQKCEARGEGLSLFIGRKPESPLEEAKRLDFRYALAQSADEALEVRLTAPNGPAGTSDYRIAFSAVPVGADRTFVHLRYGYATGALSRMAMQAYLSTSGAGKVGFTREGDELVGGMRGVLERNTMRYFLAIEAYLDTIAVPEGDRRRARAERWFDATERFPKQLREMPKERYLALKLNPAG